jgi:hypothetical protein
MLNRCEAAWDEPVSVRVLPQPHPGTPHAGLDGQWLFPVPPAGALVLLGAHGSETLVLGTDDEVVVPDVVAWTFRATAAADARWRAPARHAASLPETARPALGAAYTVSGSAPAGPDQYAEPSPRIHEPEPESDQTLASPSALQVPDDRTVTGSDLQRLLAERVEAAPAPVVPDAVEDHTVVGLQTEPSPNLPPLLPSIREPEATQRPPVPATASVPFPAPPEHTPSSPGETVAAPVATPPGPQPEPPGETPEIRATDPAQRPPMVTIVDAAGEVEVPLDAAVVVGTRPDPKSVRYRDARIVQVQGETISRSHVCLRQQSGVVLVCDLWSTNGTRVKIPGQAPFRLRDGEEVPVTANSLVEMGDGVEIRVQGRRHGS